MEGRNSSICIHILAHMNAKYGVYYQYLFKMLILEENYPTFLYGILAE